MKNINLIEVFPDIFTGDFSKGDVPFIAYRIVDGDVKTFLYQGRIVHDNVYVYGEDAPEEVHAAIPAKYREELHPRHATT